MKTTEEICYEGVCLQMQLSRLFDRCPDDDSESGLRFIGDLSRILVEMTVQCLSNRPGPNDPSTSAEFARQRSKRKWHTQANAVSGIRHSHNDGMLQVGIQCVYGTTS